MKYHGGRITVAVWFSAFLIQVDGLLAGTYQVGLAPPTTKVMIQGAAQGWPFEGWTSDHYDLYLARGEHEAMQVVVMASDALTNARVAVSVPQDSQGGGPLNGEAGVWLVGHVDVFDDILYSIEYPPYLVDYHGWYPDPLLTFTNTCNINAGDRVAFWIDVAAQREAAAGDYVATITVTADDSPTTNVQLNIHVWDFELPLKVSLPTAFSLNEVLTVDPSGGPKPLYGEANWVNKEIAQQFYDLMLARRMGVAHLYGGPDNASEELFVNVTDWLARGQHDVNLKNMGKSNPANLKKVADLAGIVPQVSAAGLLGTTYVYGYDEAGSSYFNALRDMFNQVHTSYPGLRTMTTARDSSFGLSTNLRAAVDIWVPQTDAYNQTAANQLRAEDKDMWWYVCTGPWRPYINFFVEYPAIEPRLLMGAMAYKCQTGGLLYYSVAKWLSANWHGPITSGPYTLWDPQTAAYNNGDGSLFCAGADGPLPTIRAENIRDGLEDYEYLKLLEALAETIQAGGPLTPEESAWLNSAQQLLAVPSNLVGSLTSFTRDPAVLENYRQQLASAILAGEALIPPTPGDHDHDGDVDHVDLAAFVGCVSGAAVEQTEPACAWAQLDEDEDVDLSDFGVFQRCYSGENNPADPNCAN